MSIPYCLFHSFHPCMLLFKFIPLFVLLLSICVYTEYICIYLYTPNINLLSQYNGASMFLGLTSGTGQPFVVIFHKEDNFNNHVFPHLLIIPFPALRPSEFLSVLYKEVSIGNHHFECAKPNLFKKYN